MRSERSNILDLRVKFEEYRYLKRQLEKRGFKIEEGSVSDRLRVTKDGKKVELYNDVTTVEFSKPSDFVKVALKALGK